MQMLMLTLMLSVGAPTVRAQVTIGAATAPQPYSVLELISNGQGGLRLPHLTAAQRDAIALMPEFTGNSDANGLTIYNTTNNCLEFWNGTKWISRCINEIPPIIIPTGSGAVGTGTFTGKTCFDIAFSDPDGKGGSTEVRNWQKTDFQLTHGQDPLNGINAPYSGTQIYTFIPSEDVSNVRFTYIDPYEETIKSMKAVQDYSGDIESGLPCKVKVIYKESLNETLQDVTRDEAFRPKLYVVYTDKTDGTDKYLKLTVSLQDYNCCGAKTTDGGWLNFMCHNLGADYSLDPFTYVAGTDGTGEDGTLGWLFQWGRPADGHQIRNSNTTTTLSASNPPEHGDFIVASPDWLASGSINARWGDGTGNENLPKGDNDPCPAGWKVPSQPHWSAIFTGSTKDTPPATATANVWKWNGDGFMIGNGLYLPVNGVREESTGNVTALEDQGYYWTASGTPDVNRQSALHFMGHMVNPHAWAVRARAHAIRCIVE
jgi:uncharacterized protein (TIGR02145 family)